MMCTSQYIRVLQQRMDYFSELKFHHKFTNWKSLEISNFESKNCKYDMKALYDNNKDEFHLATNAFRQ